MDPLSIQSPRPSEVPSEVSSRSSSPPNVRNTAIPIKQLHPESSSQSSGVDSEVQGPSSDASFREVTAEDDLVGDLVHANNPELASFIKATREWELSRTTDPDKKLYIVVNERGTWSVSPEKPPSYNTVAIQAAKLLNKHYNRLIVSGNPTSIFKEEKGQKTLSDESAAALITGYHAIGRCFKQAAPGIKRDDFGNKIVIPLKKGELSKDVEKLEGFEGVDLDAPLMGDSVEPAYEPAADEAILNEEEQSFITATREAALARSQGESAYLTITKGQNEEGVRWVYTQDEPQFSDFLDTAFRAADLLNRYRNPLISQEVEGDNRKVLHRGDAASYITGYMEMRRMTAELLSETHAEAQDLKKLFYNHFMLNQPLLPKAHFIAFPTSSAAHEPFASDETVARLSEINNDDEDWDAALEPVPAGAKREGKELAVESLAAREPDVARSDSFTSTVPTETQAMNHIGLAASALDRVSKDLHDFRSSSTDQRTYVHIDKDGNWSVTAQKDSATPFKDLRANAERLLTLNPIFKKYAKEKDIASFYAKPDLREQANWTGEERLTYNNLKMAYYSFKYIEKDAKSIPGRMWKWLSQSMLAKGVSSIATRTWSAISRILPESKRSPLSPPSSTGSTYVYFEEPSSVPESSGSATPERQTSPEKSASTPRSRTSSTSFGIESDNSSILFDEELINEPIPKTSSLEAAQHPLETKAPLGYSLGVAQDHLTSISIEAGSLVASTPDSGLEVPQAAPSLIERKFGDYTYRLKPAVGPDNETSIPHEFVGTCTFGNDLFAEGTYREVLNTTGEVCGYQLVKGRALLSEGVVQEIDFSQGENTGSITYKYPKGAPSAPSQSQAAAIDPERLGHVAKEVRRTKESGKFELIGDRYWLNGEGEVTYEDETTPEKGTFIDGLRVIESEDRSLKATRTGKHLPASGGIFKGTIKYNDPESTVEMEKGTWIELKNFPEVLNGAHGIRRFKNDTVQAGKFDKGVFTEKTWKELKSFPEVLNGAHGIRRFRNGSVQEGKFDKGVFTEGVQTYKKNGLTYREEGVFEAGFDDSRLLKEGRRTITTQDGQTGTESGTFSHGELSYGDKISAMGIVQHLSGGNVQ